MKSPGLLLAVPLAAALLGSGVGVLIGRHAFPAPGVPVSDGGAVAEPAPPGSALAGMAPGDFKPFKGTAADLMREAVAAGDSSAATLRLTLLLAGTPAANLARLAGEIAWGKQTSRWEYLAVRETVLRRWAETDPEGALAWTAGLPKSERQSARQQILTQWAGADTDGALKFARGLRDPRERADALAAVADVQARTDPREALRLLNAGGTPTWGRTGSIYSVWAGEDPVAAHAAALALPEGRERRDALRAVFQQWASTDPEAAYGAAQSLPAGAARTQTLETILNQWSREEPARAMAAFAALPWAENMESCSSLARGLAEADPAAALAWARSLPAGNMARNALSNILIFMASEDGPAAAAAVAGLPVALRAEQLQTVASQWASRDRDAALRWARALERPQDRAQALAACLGEFPTSDPGELSALLDEIPRGEARSHLLRRLLMNGGNSDPAGTLAWLRALPEEDRALALQDGNLQYLSRNEPRGTAEFLLESGATDLQEWTWAQTASSFAAEDPQDALAWVEALPTTRLRNSATEAALKSWATTDPDAALLHAQGLADTEARKSAVDNVFKSWADTDPEGLLAWAEGAAGDERAAALRLGAERMARFDPATGAAALAPLLRGEGGATQASPLTNSVSQIAQNWSGQDAAAACEWAATLPAGALQNSAIGAIAHGWSRQDPMAASAWITRLPTGEARDMAVGGLVNTIARSDPESAFVWAASIGDSSQRESSLTQTISNWQNIDPDAARAAVEQASLPEALRAGLLPRIPAAR